MKAAPPAEPHSYNLYFVTPDTPRFYFSNPNHGIAVSDRGLSWTADGRLNEAEFADIAAIHLQTAALGNAERVIDQCRIEFVNGTRLVVTNTSPNGLPDPAQPRCTALSCATCTPAPPCKKTAPSASPPA
jgi:hypothetical protein